MSPGGGVSVPAGAAPVGDDAAVDDEAAVADAACGRRRAGRAAAAGAGAQAGDGQDHQPPGHGAGISHGPDAMSTRISAAAAPGEITFTYESRAQRGAAAPPRPGVDPGRHRARGDPVRPAPRCGGPAAVPHRGGHRPPTGRGAGGGGSARHHSRRPGQPAAPVLIAAGHRRVRHGGPARGGLGAGPFGPRRERSQGPGPRRGRRRRPRSHHADPVRPEGGRDGPGGRPVPHRHRSRAPGVGGHGPARPHRHRSGGGAGPAAVGAPVRAARAPHPRRPGARRRGLHGAGRTLGPARGGHGEPGPGGHRRPARGSPGPGARVQLRRLTSAPDAAYRADGRARGRAGPPRRGPPVRNSRRPVPG